MSDCRKCKYCINCGKKQVAKILCCDECEKRINECFYQINGQGEFCIDCALFITSELISTGNKVIVTQKRGEN